MLEGVAVMTLGVSYSIHQQPVVLGDLLLSGDEREHDVFVPSVGNVEEVFCKGSGYSITGMTQKVIVISKDMAITWAGNEVAARLAIAELRALAAKGLDPDRVQALLDGLPAVLMTLDLELTGWYVYENCGYPIEFRSSEGHSCDCDHLRLVGNGAPLFQALLDGHQWVTGANRGMDAEGGKCLSTTCAFAGMLLELELKKSPTSLLNFFGGGYEVALFDEGSFRKLDDVTHVYWNVQVSEKGVGITQPFHIRKQFYRDANLMIMPVRFVRDGAKTGIVHQELYVVQEPGGTLKREDVSVDDLPSLNSRHTCHYFIQGEAAQVFTRVQYRERPEDNDLTIKETATGLQLKIRKRFFNEIGAILQSDPRWHPQT